MGPISIWSVRALLSKWWWVLATLSILYLLYFQSVREKRQAIARLDARIEHLHQAKAEALELREDLLLEIASQSDPAWIEMTLMKQLGVVPEGQTKVYFSQ